MKKKTTILFALSLLLVLWINARTHSSPAAGTSPGNIAEGMYTIVSWADHRCLEVPNSSCANGVGLQTFDCDTTGISNNQKFNVVGDGAGNYTINPAHSDLCLEVPEKLSDRTPVLQNACSPGKISQKWSLTQTGDNLELRDVQNNKCLEVWNKRKVNYTPVTPQRCNNDTSQRWTLHKTTLNNDTGIICKDSPNHPARDCSGVNNQQKQIYLGKTLTKSRCEDLCKSSSLSGCKWDGSR
jgi:ricin-type beta-trefoil lectin protein